MKDIDQCHADYKEKQDDWKRVRDSLKGQSYIKKQRTEYLPKTSGMIARSADKYKDTYGNTPGELQYCAYLERARFPDLVGQAKAGIMGLAYDKEPENETPFKDEPVTINKLGVEELSRVVLGEVLEAGTSVIVVDAPQEGGDPYLVVYPIESMTDWATDDRDTSTLTIAKFVEVYYEEGDIFKREPKDRYRIYRLEDGRATVEVRNEDGDLMVEPFILPFNELPIVICGSVDNLPTLDSIPLLPIADAAFRIYQISADHAQFIHGHGQGTHWATGVDDSEQDKIVASGLGVGSMLFAENPDAKFGVATMAEGSDEVYLNAIKREERTASSNAVAMVSDTTGVEAAESIRIKAAAQHATIYTILWSVSNGIVRALEMLQKWGGKAGTISFELQTDFTNIEAAEQLINALDKAILSGNAPRSALFNVLRGSGITEKSDDEIEAEILDGGGAIEDDSEN